jgi:pimeloyl-[acyl-carrier protein] synthase
MTEESSAGEFDLTSPSFVSDPELSFSRMRREAPVYFDPTLEAWLLTRHDDVELVLRDARFSVDRNGVIGRGGKDVNRAELDRCNRFFAQWMVFSDPPRQLRLRSLVARPFQPGPLTALRPMIESCTNQLLDSVEGRASFDALSELGDPLPALVTAHMLDLPASSIALLKQWTSSMFALFGAGAATGEEVFRAHASLLAASDYFGELIAARLARPGSDLISHIVQNAGPELCAEEVLGLVITLVAGAYETTSYLIANGLFALLTHPDQLDRLRQEPELIGPAVEELMRFVGPAFSVQRRALSDVELRGKLIRERAVVYCMLHAANHDPLVFDEPARLDVRRTPGRQLGFGVGGHFCLGAWLSRIETQLAIQAVVRRFPKLSLCDVTPEWNQNLAIRGLRRLRLGTGQRDVEDAQTTGAERRLQS